MTPNLTDALDLAHSLLITVVAVAAVVGTQAGVDRR